jgi:DNA-directed RNA polymerase subunit beta
MIERKSFGTLNPVIPPPNLIEIQTQSYKDFLQLDVPPAKRDNKKGLQAAFNEIFPVEAADGKYSLHFVEYSFGQPKFSILEALADGGTYAAPLRVKFDLREGEEHREEEVFMGDIPLMTPDGAFVVNGAERVIVSQLHRSPGVCTESAPHTNGQTLYSVRIIPDRGNWIEIQFDTSDILWVYMDRRRRRRKFYATTFLRALGFGSDEQILGLYYTFKKIVLDSTIKVAKNATNCIRLADVDATNLKHLHFKDDVIDVDSRAVLARRYEPVSEAVLRQMSQANFADVEVVDVSWDEGVLLKTLLVDQTHTEEEALTDIYRRLRPGDPATASNAKQLLRRLFFDQRHYDLTKVGRHKINAKLGLEGKVDSELRTLDESGIDVVESIRWLLDIRVGRSDVDDIDHLGSRRIRTAGELVENACRVGLSRTEHLIRERMSVFDSATGVISPSKLVTAKSLSAVVQDFFGRSQLSQFMDQTNPLSALAHKRRLSALGPGGMNRDRAGFEVRDVHTSHYGRICPIETPEGPNIGLISSLGLYAHINEYGFIESPYRRVVDGKVTDEVVYMSADVEEQYVIAQANSLLGADGSFLTDRVTARHKTEFLEVPSSSVQFVDVSPLQVISIAAGLIPFLEHDDANRALMGANMMRQAVPLLRPDRPFVATGLEHRAAVDSCVTVLAVEDGIVAYVSATEIVVTDNGKMPPRNKKQGPGYRVYNLQKFRRTNATTCFNQKPIVKVGDAVKVGDCLADGPSTKDGELALGKNLLCAYMPWNGFNFEDAILVSERIVRDDVFTSIHIQDYEVMARDTKLGAEEITADIPNVGEDALRNLDADGVIRIGAEVRPGDILVGKITPKSETELAPEERLLRAIFGAKAADVRDSSLKVPSGTYGVVMNVKVITKQDLAHGLGRSSPIKRINDDDVRDLVEDDDFQNINPESGEDEDSEVRLPSNEKSPEDLEAERRERIASLEDDCVNALSKFILGETISFEIVDANSDEVIVPADHKVMKRAITRIAKAHCHVNFSGEVMDDVVNMINKFKGQFDELEASIDNLSFDGASSGDSSVIKQVRVYIAEKKNLSVGDKLAGRHGNKGVVSRIVKDCDMPYLPDGTPVDIVLNPLGVPSRMNLGQLFEAYLGLACRELGIYAATPVFDGVPEKTIDELLQKAHDSQVARGINPWINPDGKSVVYDGRTGQPFDQRVVVGGTYFLKLHHLVTDKIHARAIGPYSLVTQQPLGGKAQYGGQRMGEMEVWALEAYGVAYALQELLTVKSDDVAGRTRIYESIVKGTNTLEAGMPESFSVLMNELRGLCLNMKLIGDDVEDEIQLPAALDNTPAN